MLVVMMISLYTTRVLLVTLGVNDYGLYNVVCGFVSMFSFLNTSMANGTQRFYNFEIGRNGDCGISKIYTHSLLIQIVLALFIILGIETLGIWYLDNKMVIPEGRGIAAYWIFQSSMISLFFVIITVPYTAAIMAYEKMGFYAFLSILDAILKLVIVIILPYLPQDHLIWYGCLSATISGVNFILSFWYSKIKFRDLRVEKRIENKTFASILTFSGWNIFGSFSNMFRIQGLSLVYNFFWGTVVNAANGVAGQVNAAVESLTNSFLVAVRPQMIKSYAAGQEDYMIKMAFSVSKLTFYLVMIFAVPMIWEIKTILDIWLGEKQYPELTIVFCQLTLLMSLFGSFSVPISMIVQATGIMKRFQVYTSLTTLSVVPFAFLLSTMGGSPTSVLVLAIFFVIAAQLVRLLLVKEIVPFCIKQYVKEVIIPVFTIFVIAMLFVFILHTILSTGTIGTFAVILIGIGLSCGLIYFIGLSPSERNLVLSFFNWKS